MNPMTYKKVVRIVGTALCGIVLSLAVFFAHSWVSVERLLKVSSESYAMHYAVDYANTKILSATLIQDSRERIIEINNRFISRARATELYESLGKMVHKYPSVEAVYSDMKMNRGIYRKKQDALVGAIIENPNDPKIFELWQDYQIERSKYDGYIHEIMMLVSDEIAFRGKIILGVFIAVIFLSLYVVDKSLGIYLKTRHSGRRRCSICLDILPSKISLTARQKVNNEVRIGRVCCSCYDTIYGKHDETVELKHYRVVHPRKDCCTHDRSYYETKD